MFRINEIKDSKRKIKRRPPSETELVEELPEERTLPYFSVVPEQVLSDERYRKLGQSHQALFWIFVVHVLWRDLGRCARHAGIIAKRMGIKISEWDALEKQLLNLNLLILCPDGFYLIQPELRSQYLMTLQTNNGKRHEKA
ncbi:MAG: hypothetical protein M0T70_01160 [Geobacteraceae bacterium]|nr:hypothetical protein [Geobacteraceae bacterium]